MNKLDQWNPPQHSKDLTKAFLWTLRDTADRDYVAARTLWRANLFQQYFWSTSQALEKYLKCISALNGLPKYKKPNSSTQSPHCVLPLLEHLRNHLPFEIRLKDSTLNFAALLDAVAPYRYGQMDWETDGLHLLALDKAVWDIRRYTCIIFDFYSGELSPAAKAQYAETPKIKLQQYLALIDAAEDQRAYEFAIPGGWLEKVIADKNHPSRSALTWKNFFYSSQKRKSLKIHLPEAAEYPLFMWNPELIHEYVYFVHMEKEVRDHYERIAVRWKEDGCNP